MIHINRIENKIIFFLVILSALFAWILLRGQTNRITMVRAENISVVDGTITTENQRFFVEFTRPLATQQDMYKLVNIEPPIEFTINVSGNRMILEITDVLSANEDYTLKISQNILDIYQHSLINDYQAEFKTKTQEIVYNLNENLLLSELLAHESENETEIELDSTYTIAKAENISAIAADRKTSSWIALARNGINGSELSVILRPENKKVDVELPIEMDIDQLISDSHGQLWIVGKAPFNLELEIFNEFDDPVNNSQDDFYPQIYRLDLTQPLNTNKSSLFQKINIPDNLTRQLARLHIAELRGSLILEQLNYEILEYSLANGGIVSSGRFSEFQKTRDSQDFSFTGQQLEFTSNQLNSELVVISNNEKLFAGDDEILQKWPQINGQNQLKLLFSEEKEILESSMPRYKLRFTRENFQQLTEIELPQYSVEIPSWSPDGNLIGAERISASELNKPVRLTRNYLNQGRPKNADIVFFKYDSEVDSIGEPNLIIANAYNLLFLP